jgi:hypothetical protein
MIDRYAMRVTNGFTFEDWRACMVINDHVTGVINLSLSLGIFQSVTDEECLCLRERGASARGWT